jgi:SAM-dependent methyltransferase
MQNVSLYTFLAALVAAPASATTMIRSEQRWANSNDQSWASLNVAKTEAASTSERVYSHACSSFLTHKKEDVQVGASQKGWAGKEWSPCTHLRNYGLNFAPFVARFLAYQLAPKTAMEFGCGLGTTSDFVARFAGAQVTCIEPEETLGELIMSLRDMKGNGNLNQLALNVFSEESAAKECLASGDLKSDLVYSFEVAEHIPAKYHPQLVQLLAQSTNKWLVFSAARPDQLGTGHLPESMHLADWWQKTFEQAGLVYMPKLTHLAREAAYPLRSYDLYSNLLVFRRPEFAAVDTDKPHEMLALFEHDWWGQGTTMPNNLDRKNHLEAFAKGSNSALWPGLTAKEQMARTGDMCSESSSLIEGADGSSSPENPAFESAWGAHFYHAAA